MGEDGEEEEDGEKGEASIKSGMEQSEMRILTVLQNREAHRIILGGVNI